jgi:hypothetical protein
MTTAKIDRGLSDRQLTQQTIIGAVQREVQPVVKALLRAVNSLIDDRHAVTTVAVAAGALHINAADGEVHVVELTQDVTSVELVTPPADAATVVVMVHQQGAFTVAGWPVTVLWQGGAPPTITATAGRVDLVTLRWLEGDWLGSAQQDFY